MSDNIRLQDLLENITDQLTKAKFENALDLLKELAKLLDDNNIELTHTRLSARYTEDILRNDNSLTHEQQVQVKNLIIKAINDLVYSVKSGTRVEVIGTSNGRIVHNIPGQMEIDEEEIYTVRIAKDDKILLKDFETQNPPEDLETSLKMEVEIRDLTGGKIFQIRLVSPNPVQRITSYAVTAWDFAIKPLQKGSHKLKLYVHFIEDLDGKEVRRNLSFEKTIEIITEPLIEFVDWEATNIQLINSTKKEFLPLIPMPDEDKNVHTIESKNVDREKIDLPRSGPSRIFLLSKIAAIILFAAIVYTFFHHKISYKPLDPGDSSDPNQPSYADRSTYADRSASSNKSDNPDLITEKTIELVLIGCSDPKTLMINGIIVSSWIADQPNVILLSRHTLEKYWSMDPDHRKIEVIGKDFACKLILKPNDPLGYRVELPCSKINKPDILFTVQIMGPDNLNFSFNTQKINADAKKLSNAPAEDKKWIYTFLLKGNDYTIRALDPSGKIKCDPWEGHITSDTKIQMLCVTPIDSVDLTFQLPFHANGISCNDVFLPCKFEVERTQQCVLTLAKGKYTFNVVDPNQNYSCKSTTLDVQNSQPVILTCDRKEQFYDITVKTNFSRYISKSDTATICLVRGKIKYCAKSDRLFENDFSFNHVSEGKYEVFQEGIDERNKKADCRLGEIVVDKNGIYKINVGTKASCIRLINGIRHALNSFNLYIDDKPSKYSTKVDDQDLLICFDTKNYTSIKLEKTGGYINSGNAVGYVSVCGTEFINDYKYSASTSLTAATFNITIRFEPGRFNFDEKVLIYMDNKSKPTKYTLEKNNGTIHIKTINGGYHKLEFKTKPSSNIPVDCPPLLIDVNKESLNFTYLCR